MANSNGTKSAFSATVAGIILCAQKVIQDKYDWNTFVALMEFFRGLSDAVQVSMKDFSDAVTAAVRNQFFGEEERALLAAAIMQRISAVHPGALEIYLKATRDEELATVCVQNFFAHEPNFDAEIGHNDPIAWDLKRALSAIEALAPDQTQVFAATVLEMFPNLPAGVDGKGGLAGLFWAKSQKTPSGMIANDGTGPVPASRTKQQTPKGGGSEKSAGRPESKIPDRHYVKPAEVAFMKPTVADGQALDDYNAKQKPSGNFAMAAGLDGFVPSKAKAAVN